MGRRVKLAGYPAPNTEQKHGIYCTALVYEFVRCMKPGDALIMTMDGNEEFDFAMVKGASMLFGTKKNEFE